jgi:hypothetical protein
MDLDYWDFDGVIDKTWQNTVPVRVKLSKPLFSKTGKSYFGSLSDEFSIPANKFCTNKLDKFALWFSCLTLVEAMPV